jgi:hypothetical protein
MLVALLLTTVLAAEASPPPAVVKAPDPTQAKICKREPPIGSRLPQKLCLTAYEWAERRAASLRMMDQMVGKGTWP